MTAFTMPTTLEDLKRKWYNTGSFDAAANYVRALEAVLDKVRELGENPCLSPDANSACIEEILKGKT